MPDIPDLRTEISPGVWQTQRAIAAEITRQGDDWQIQWPQEGCIEIQGVEPLRRPLGSVTLRFSRVASKTVEIGGTTYPLTLAYLILKQAYCDAAQGILVEDPLPPEQVAAVE
jgi:hypothetical protein